jgi:hypothetical protein
VRVSMMMIPVQMPMLRSNMMARVVPVLRLMSRSGVSVSCVPRVALKSQHAIGRERGIRHGQTVIGERGMSAPSTSAATSSAPATSAANASTSA